MRGRLLVRGGACQPCAACCCGALAGGALKALAAGADRVTRGPSVALPRCTIEPGPISIWWIR
ncbi:hypothetical protein Srufu_060740 [Streptomyces libani subsp. rufus]|nr:hypothetical protein Srufu_060740 [Streptomyces libani subsp. rufus]